MTLNVYYWLHYSNKFFVFISLFVFIIGDGTPMDFWDFTGWRHIVQNKEHEKPVVLTPHLMKHMNPKVKFIVLLRNPIDR